MKWAYEMWRSFSPAISNLSLPGADWCANTRSDVTTIRPALLGASAKIGKGENEFLPEVPLKNMRYLREPARFVRNLLL